MSENQYTQYSYNPYQQQNPQAEDPIAAQPKTRNGILGYIFGRDMAGKLKGNPLLATVSLLAVGVAFAGIVAISYPDNAKTQSDIPVIKAETTAFKEVPSDAGGMSIPNQDSTIFSVMRDDAFEAAPGKNIRNLLDPSEPTEAPVEDKIASFAEEAEALLLDTESTGKPAFSKDDIKTEVAAAPETKTAAPPKAAPQNTTKTVTLTRETIPAKELIRKADSKKPDALHAAGSSPETLAFVRSVLDQKDTAKTLNGVQPAAGNPATTGSATGIFYVQLGSVTSAEGAKTEWTKLQKALPLGNINHRIQEANLGERGTYYRIQAGPLDKNSANALCEEIKAQKPGGCLVIK